MEAKIIKAHNERKLRFEFFGTKYETELHRLLLIFFGYGLLNNLLVVG